MSVHAGRSGPSIIIRNGELVEEAHGVSETAAALGMQIRTLPRHLVVTPTRLCLGCTTLSADAVEFVIKRWREKHPEAAA